MNDKNLTDRGNHIVDLIANSAYMLQFILIVLKVFGLERLTWIQTLAPIIATAGLGVLAIATAIITSAIENVVETVTKKK